MPCRHLRRQTATAVAVASAVGGELCKAPCTSAPPPPTTHILSALSHGQIPNHPELLHHHHFRSPEQQPVPVLEVMGPGCQPLGALQQRRHGCLRSPPRRSLSPAGLTWLRAVGGRWWASGARARASRSGRGGVGKGAVVQQRRWAWAEAEEMGRIRLTSRTASLP